jgi:hypothetical protein
MPSHNDVLARYGNWYKAADDLFATCFISRGGRHLILYQGLAIVTLESHETARSKHEALVELLAQPIPTDWLPSSYVGAGFNFVPEAEGANANEIAVLGSNRPATISGFQYFVAPPDSELGQLVKAIANVD